MTPEDYLSKLQRLIAENFHPTDDSGGMTVAKIGTIASRLIGVAPIEVGYAKFKDALLELERQGHVRIGANQKGALSIWVTTDSAKSEGLSSSTAGAQKDVLNNSKQFRKLRNSLWLAVVSANPDGKRFINRKTGEIRLGQSEDLQLVQDWVQIDHLSVDVDREDAKAFLVDEELDADQDLVATLDQPDWFQKFPSALRQRDFTYATRWNRRRSNRVITNVQEWMRLHDIPMRFIFELPTTRVTPSVEDISHRAPRNTQRGVDKRAIILEALHQMKTEELLDLPIPARCFIAAIEAATCDSN